MLSTDLSKMWAENRKGNISFERFLVMDAKMKSYIFHEFFQKMGAFEL
jgi:hypothetical protein